MIFTDNLVRSVNGLRSLPRGSHLRHPDDHAARRNDDLGYAIAVNDTGILQSCFELLSKDKFVFFYLYVVFAICFVFVLFVFRFLFLFLFCVSFHFVFIHCVLNSICLLHLCFYVVCYSLYVLQCLVSVFLWSVFYFPFLYILCSGFYVLIMF